MRQIERAVSTLWQEADQAGERYLPLIEKKVGALDQAAPLQGWELPEQLLTL